MFSRMLKKLEQIASCGRGSESAARKINCLPSRDRRERSSGRLFRHPLGILFLSLALFPAAIFAKGPVAVVASLAGGASAQVPKARTQVSIHALDWLDAGVRIDVHPKSSMKLILLNGRSYELSAGARATLTEGGLTASNSQVRELNRLPPIPRLVPIAANTADVPGATAIRGGSRVKNLYPQQAWAIASHVKLSFAPVPEVSDYGVILEDEEGNTILRLNTPATSVDVPSGALKPGARYSWRVRAFGRSSVLAEASAEFWTISKDDLDRRSAFAAALNAGDDALRLALIAGIDQQSGLLADACDELEAALRLRPSDPALAGALAAARTALESARDR